MKEEDRLWIYVVYFNPKDFPGEYVIRGQSPNPDGTIEAEARCIVASSLEVARKMLHQIRPGLVLLARHPEDDPVIVETWI